MITRLNRETKNYRLFKALQAGERITPSQAKKRFGINNLSAEVTRLRQNGFAIYAKNHMAGNHVDVTYYVMGTPSRELVAAGYRALQLGL